MKSKIIDAVAIFGTQTDLAKMLQVSPQAVQQWIRQGFVPAERCPVIERLSKGRVKCEDLNPRVDWGYIRLSMTQNSNNVQSVS